MFAWAAAYQVSIAVFPARFKSPQVGEKLHDLSWVINQQGWFGLKDGQ